MKHRKFIITIEVDDYEGPNDTNEQSANALKDYLRDAFADLQFNNINIQVSCE